MTGKIIAGVIASFMAAAIVVYGCFAIYEGSWSLASHNLNHSLQLQQQNANGQAKIAVSGWNYQSALGQRISTGIQSVTTDTTNISQYVAAGDTTDASNMKNQRMSDVNIVCTQAMQINGTLPPGQFDTTWINANCQNGSVNPSSAFYYAGN